MAPLKELNGNDLNFKEAIFFNCVGGNSRPLLKWLGLSNDIRVGLE